MADPPSGLTHTMTNPPPTLRPWSVESPARRGAHGEENIALFASPCVVIDRFRAGPGDRVWRIERVRTHMLAFPRRFVEIEHAGRPPIIASPNRVMLYDADQEFQRRSVGEPDHNDGFHFAPSILRDALATHDPAVRDRAAIFMETNGPISARTYVLQRCVVARAESGVGSAMEIEEAAMEVLDAALTDARRAWAECSSHRRTRTCAAHRDAARAALRVIAEDPLANHALDNIAQSVGLSVYHLCRVFRRETGLTISAFIHQQRLRRSLEPLSDPRADLTTIALTHGYSSHSHYSSRFRSVFGMTPSVARRRFARVGAKVA